MQTLRRSQETTPSGGNKWYINTSEIAKIIDAQKSSFSNLYYINYGFQIIELVKKEPDLHYHTGLGSLDSNENKRIKELLDLEYPINQEVRKNELHEKIQRILVHTIQSVNDEKEFHLFLQNLKNWEILPLFIRNRYNLFNRV